ncbi:hypothetical protein [Streptomyces sp. NPDC060194]|uniref:hypothetical protein n=1 Tax=Streptomyces sp. NPDC060194 TaxID=3347069 RepID=UPI00365AB87B
MTASPRGRTGRAAVLGVVCAALGAALVGCGAEEDPDQGTNGVGRLTAAQIEKKALAAAGRADSVRLTGAVVSQGRTYRLAMQLSDEGGRGRVTTPGATYELLRVGEDLFLKADAEFWASDDKPSETDEAAAGKLEDKYVRVPEGDPAYKRLRFFTERETLLDGLLTLHGTKAKGERTKVDGVRTIEVSGDKGAGGSFDVALEGTPFPLRVERGGDAGTIGLADWGEPLRLEPPAEDETLDYGKQLPTGKD